MIYSMMLYSNYKRKIKTIDIINGIILMMMIIMVPMVMFGVGGGFSTKSAPSQNDEEKWKEKISFYFVKKNINSLVIIKKLFLKYFERNFFICVIEIKFIFDSYIIHLNFFLMKMHFFTRFNVGLTLLLYHVMLFWLWMDSFRKWNFCYLFASLIHFKLLYVYFKVKH